VEEGVVMALPARTPPGEPTGNARDLVFLVRGFVGEDRQD
jgi:hypothetical protein